MDYKELNQVLENLNRAMYDLEETYMDNGGECTEETDAMESTIADLQELLNTDGVDLLGRWLKSREDQKKALKAEKDYLTREIAAIDNTIDFIKSKVCQVMAATGQQKLKGDKGYSFSLYESSTTSVDKDALKDLYQAKVEKALADILPADVTITLGASVKLVPEGAELPAYYNRQESPAVRFAKPRASREE